MQMLPWIVALAAFALLAAVLAAWALKSAPKRRSPLPADWALAARPVFSNDERRMHRLLCQALPHHVVLAKLPLVRFCQPTDPASVSYWYHLLGHGHVTFAVCSANGRVIAAVDLDSDRTASRRMTRIKQSVLAVCRVRYLRCSMDQPPSVEELQLLVPTGAALTAGPNAAVALSGDDLHLARASLVDTVASRRAERAALWQDSAVFPDSFFAGDSYGGRAAPRDFAPTSPAPIVADPAPASRGRPDERGAAPPASPV